MDSPEIHAASDVSHGFPGSLWAPRYRVDLWDESLARPIDSLFPREILLVLSCLNNSEVAQHKLNIDLWRKVLTPRGVVGWVHLDGLRNLK